MPGDDAESARDLSRAPRDGTLKTWSPRARAMLPFAPIALGVGLLASIAIGRIYAKVGHAGPTLDDAYIHFQYARAIAEGHPLRYQAGEPVTSGATSLVWPLVLAPFYALGLRGASLVWAAWVLSFVALGALAHEAHALTLKLAGRQAAAGAAAMVLAFSGLAWCAASGMEVVPFAWALARSARLASEWIENDDAKARTTRRRYELLAMAWIAPLLRPEGAIATLMITFAIARYPRVRTIRERALGGAAFLAIFALPLLLLATTGHASSTTAQVKLLIGSPYCQGRVLVATIAANARQLVGDILDGGHFSGEFLPAGGAPLAMAGLVAIAAVGARANRAWRAAFVIVLALTMFAPCTYDTFLWNRLRYLWPFATGWFIGLACLARLFGDLCAKVRRRWHMATTLAVGILTGMLAMRIDWTLDDVAMSASGIDRQQATLGRWAAANLPVTARIGVNDTGAIAYFGNRRTFDVVGLTTNEEGRYWVAGAGSRLEHYERLYATEPWRLPTHFIVYPQWFACEPVLGAELHEETVTDSTILGGATMGVYDADYTHLGSGEAPWTTLERVVDTVDVADLESEAEHAYALLGASAKEEEIAQIATDPNGRPVVDGGRTMRTAERFVVHLPEGQAVRGLVRIDAATPAHVRVLAGGRDVSAFDASPLGWSEVAFDVPAADAHASTVIELRASSPITVFHYWFAFAFAFAFAPASAPGE